MNVTLHRGVRDSDVVNRLWDIYRRGYEGIAVECILPEVLDEVEFREIVSDPATRTHIAWDHGVAIGLSCVATDMTKVPWLNLQYFRNKYPDLTREGRVHYVVFSVVDPEYSGTKAMFAMMRRGMEVEAAEQSLLVVDVIRANQRGQEGGMPAMVQRMARSVAGAAMEEIEVHRFFSVDFAAAASRVDSPEVSADETVEERGHSIGLTTSQ
jgi:hypothetical protein